MPGARRRRQSGRHRAHDELFGPTAARARGPAAGGAGEPPAPREPAAAAGSADLLRLAAEADTEGRVELAMQLYQRVLAADPLDLEGRIGLARVLDRAGRPDLALAALDAGLAQQPDRTELLLARGRAHGQQRNYPAAEADLRRVLRLHPSHGPAHFEVGLILIRRGRAAEAASTFGRAIAFGPESAHAYTHLAEALSQTGRVADAATALERALALDPAEPRAYHLLGRVLDRLQRSDEATAMYRRARELDGR